jgi:hypothetical protein
MQMIFGGLGIGARRRVLAGSRRSLPGGLVSHRVTRSGVGASCDHGEQVVETRALQADHITVVEHTGFVPTSRCSVNVALVSPLRLARCIFEFNF